MTMAQRRLRFAVILFLTIQYCEAQIPNECAGPDLFPPGSTTERKCCPDYNEMECGGPTRGNCTKLMPPDSVESDNRDSDPRIEWPTKYFTHVCVCTEKYGGVDCGSCAYGRYPHPTCNEMMVAKRRNLKHYSSEDWEKYLNIIKMTRTHDSGYKAIVDGRAFNPSLGWSSIEMESRTINLYQFFVWIHYLVAKDSEPQNKVDKNVPKRDFAHEGAGFLTWHRQLLLWLEWKIQEMLRETNPSDYYEFRLPYWDWTDKKERRRYFTQDRLGETIYGTGNQSHIPQKVIGTLFKEGSATEWMTICWKNKEGPNGDNCDPEDPTKIPLLRCPKREKGKKHSDPCSNDDEYWPTAKDAWDAVEKLTMYDAKDKNTEDGRYNACPSQKSFRSLLEGFIVQKTGCNTRLNDDGEEEMDLMCSAKTTTECARSRTLHNSVHILLGAADIQGLNQDSTNTLRIDPLHQGVMAHVAASPNDPIFINHHAMIDCIFEDWFKKDNYDDYPPDVIKDGHRINDYIVPFIPVYTHKDMYKPSKHFGYVCGAVALAPVLLVTVLTSVCSLVISLML